MICDYLDNVESNCRILFIGPCEPILCYCLCVLIFVNICMLDIYINMNCLKTA